MTEASMITHLQDREVVDPTMASEDFVLMVRGGTTTALLVLYDRRSRHPVAVARLARSEADREACEREAHALHTLGRSLAAETAQALPRLLHHGELRWEGREPAWGVLESALPGASLASYWHKPPRFQQSVAALSTALQWLSDFQRATRPQGRTLPPLDVHVRTSLDGWETAAPLTPAEREAITSLLSRCRPSSPLDRWVAAAHGDFSPEHLLYAGGQLHIGDWTRFRDEDFGYRDAGRLIAAATENWRRPPGPHLAGRTSVDRAIAEFLERVGVGAEARDDVLALTFIDEVTRAEDRERARRREARRFPVRGPTDARCARVEERRGALADHLRRRRG